MTWHAKKRRLVNGLMRSACAAAMLIVTLMLVMFMGHIMLRASHAFQRVELLLTITPPSHYRAEKATYDNGSMMIRTAVSTMFPGMHAEERDALFRDIINYYAPFHVCREWEKHPTEPFTLWVATTSTFAQKLHNTPVGDNIVYDALRESKRIRTHFDMTLFTNPDSQEPSYAGLQVGMTGTLWTLLICICTAFPLGILASLYIYECPHRSRWVTIMEINIHNLSAVPSIIYGIAGLSLCLMLLHLPRSSVVAGGLTLSMMALPIIIIVSKQALASVPYSLREAAIALGATRLQVIFHHVLPAALPGIVTGCILSIARILGETAPLLLIGMVAFIITPPLHLGDPSTTIPVQIYLWSQSSEIGLVEKTAAAIIVLLIPLALLQIAALYVRKRFLIRWSA